MDSQPLPQKDEAHEGAGRDRHGQRAAHASAPDERAGGAAAGPRMRERGGERQADADGDGAGVAAHAHHRRSTAQVWELILSASFSWKRWGFQSIQVCFDTA